jgi:hypothetical protein
MPKSLEKKVVVETETFLTDTQIIVGMTGMLFAASAAIATILTIYVFS